MTDLLWPLILSWLTGAAIVLSCWSGERDGPRAVFFKFCLSLLVGLAASSCSTFLSILIFPGSFGASLAVELVGLLSAIGVLVIRWRRRVGEGVSPRDLVGTRSDKRSRLALCATSFMMIAVVACMVPTVLSESAVTQIYPHGDYDAWQFWNLRARCIFREGCLDRRMFAPPLNPISHPLLLPLTIVRAWQWTGSDSPRIAAGVSVLFGMLTPLTLFGGVLWLRGTFTAALATTVLLSPWGFPVHCGTQVADAPIGVFMIAAVILVGGALRLTGDRYRLFLLSGMMTGATAWLKNEGLLFCLLMAGGVTVAVLWGRPRINGIRDVLAFTCGIGMFMVFVIYFRMTLTTPCPPGLGHELSGNWKSVFDASRHATFLQVFQITSPRTFDESIFPWCFAYAITIWIAGLLAGCKPKGVLREGGGFAAAIALLMVIGYYTVLLITPHDLYTMLCDTLFRLLLQLWPLAVLGFFLCLPTFGDVLRSHDVGSRLTKRIALGVL